MVYREKLNQLLVEVQELESLVGKLLAEAVPDVQLLSKSSSFVYSILESIKEIESEQIQLMNAHLVEQQEELSHLSVLLDQYKRMAESCKKDILATKQELVASESLLAQKEPDPLLKESAKEEVIDTPALPIEETIKRTPVWKEPDSASVIPVAAKGNVSLNDLLGKKNLSDFRKAFSLNDRFRFRRDLFHGSEKQMNQVIADLNHINSLDEALHFIDTNLSWDMNNETVVDFIKLLEKRYI